MIYFEFYLHGNVKVYEMADRLLILRSKLEARARALPEPSTIDEAQAFFRQACFDFRAFQSLERAEDWADSFNGFRCDEARAEFGRFLNRIAEQHRAA